MSNDRIFYPSVEVYCPLYKPNSQKVYIRALGDGRGNFSLAQFQGCEQWHGSALCDACAETVMSGFLRDHPECIPLSADLEE